MRMAQRKQGWCLQRELRYKDSNTGFLLGYRESDSSHVNSLLRKMAVKSDRSLENTQMADEIFIVISPFNFLLSGWSKVRKTTT